MLKVRRFLSLSFSSLVAVILVFIFEFLSQKGANVYPYRNDPIDYLKMTYVLSLLIGLTFIASIVSVYSTIYCICSKGELNTKIYIFSVILTSLVCVIVIILTIVNIHNLNGLIWYALKFRNIDSLY